MMRKGKLTPEELQRLIFDIIKSRREEVRLHAGIGEDCAALLCEDYILVTTDPITTKCNNPGGLAIHINANDIAASGGEPLAVTMTILAPTDATTREIDIIMKEAESTASELGIEIIGGHTEFTDAVNRFVISCTMLGRVKTLIGGTGSNPGDSIIMTKYAAIEGTLILADMYPQYVREDSDAIQWMKNNLSVMNEGRIVHDLDITAMHDITEGGVLGAVSEMCNLRQNGAEIDISLIPIKPVTKKLTDMLNLNPYQLLSSGSMLITSNEPDKIIDALKAQGIKGTIVGTINDSGIVTARYNDHIETVNVEADEIFKVNEDKKL